MKHTLRSIMVLFVLCLGGLITGSSRSQNAVDPATRGPCGVTTRTVTLSGNFSIRLYYPSTTNCTSPGAPYPVVVFAHGFTMFGFSDGVAENENNGTHLASWGTVVAIPKLPDDFEQRAQKLREALDYVESEAANASSPLYHLADPARVGSVGHSLGGASALALARRDGRVDVAVGLDPVYHGGMPGNLTEVWNPNPEVPQISGPTLVLGAPASDCNADGDYQRLYDLLTARPRARVLISEASHCVFADPGGSSCASTCGGTTNAQKRTLARRYMTAWLLGYLRGQAPYADYLAGTQAQQDVAQGLVSIEARMGTLTPRAYLPFVQAN